MIQKNVRDWLFDFIAPQCCEDAKKEILELIRKQLTPPSSYLNSKADVCILWYLNPKFMKIAHKYGIKIGTKEVVVTPNYIQATENTSIPPHIVYDGNVLSVL